MHLTALAALLTLALAADARAGSWVRPVPGEAVARFAYDPAMPFQAGARRNARFATRAGASVRAACGGRVAFAGAAPGHGRVVTLRCGRWRVTHLGLRDTSVEGAVRAGDPIGVAAGRTVALGVRRAGHPFGYVDPERLLRPPPAPVGPVPAARARPAAPRRPGPAPARPPVLPSPWAVWAGLGALLAAAVPSGAMWRSRRSAAGAPRPVPASGTP